MYRNENSATPFGQTLRDLRQRYGFTEAEAAARATPPASQGSYSRWETGAVEPKLARTLSIYPGHEEELCATYLQQSVKFHWEEK